MESFFYSLIYSSKTKRWFRLLAELEENEQITSSELATKVDCSLRTVHGDVRAITNYFGSSIHLLGNDRGYYFAFEDPSDYMRKKQELLEEEPLFHYLNQVLMGTKKDNQQWATTLAFSTASFGRIKRVLGSFLKQHYQLTITSSTNQLVGEEAAVRQLMYDFYFTLPFYPKAVEDMINKLISGYQLISKGTWEHDPLILNQWIQVTNMRVAQGYILPEQIELKNLQRTFTEEVDQLICLSLPEQEKAALFLLSLTEEQFSNPFKQKKFISQFSPTAKRSCPVVDFEEVNVCLFEIMVSLMNTFFRLSPTVTPETAIGNSSSAESYLNQMMTRYVEVKQQCQKPIYLSFDLSGPVALKQWTEKNVRDQFISAGYHLVENIQSELFPFVHRLIVSDKENTQGKGNAVCLSKIPSKNEIKATIQEFDQK